MFYQLVNTIRVKTITAMNAQKQPSKFIKPSVPTPSNLKHYKIGFIDELAPFMDVAIVLFFTKNTNHNSKFGDQLEKSLEKTLTRLYPLAGRFVEESQTIDCNDEGVEFIQAKVNIKLEDILGLEVNARSIKELLPLKTIPHDKVLTIQLTTFECGGVALGVSATHKVVDTSTLCTFVNEWAAMNREENDIKFTTPGFISSSLFPARRVRPILIPFITDEDLLSKYTWKKLSFSESDISNMKAKAITNARISKVQLVSATIWKALIGVDRVTHGYLRESMLSQAINLREKMASPIPSYSCGNLWGLCSTTVKTNEELENLLNYSVKKTIDEYSKVHHDSEQGQMIVLNSILNVTNTPLSTNIIISTSWCKFPFYEADFGFGKPIWAVPWTTPMKNAMLLIDNANGNGVDAYIFLEVKDVPYFKEGLDVKVF
ncbi:putative transferase [Helianthus annuus]|nr:putative transferase [Helianthus annuus]